MFCYFQSKYNTNSDPLFCFCFCFSFFDGTLQKILPFCTREIWIITACLGLINATASRYSEGLVAPDIEKEFYRVQGDLYSLCRTKVEFSHALQVTLTTTLKFMFQRVFFERENAVSLFQKRVVFGLW